MFTATCWMVLSNRVSEIAKENNWRGREKKIHNEKNSVILILRRCKCYVIGDVSEKYHMCDWSKKNRNKAKIFAALWCFTTTNKKKQLIIISSFNFSWIFSFLHFTKLKSLLRQRRQRNTKKIAFYQREKLI